MKLRILIFVFLILFGLSSCESYEEINSNQFDENSDIKVVDLGISSAKSTSLSSNSRNPWDMILIDNDLYVATGDFANNSGTISIWKYDESDSEWINSGDVEQEAVIRFLNLNDQNIAIGADPIGRPNYAENYVLNNGKWEVFTKIKDALHTFDAEYFNNEFYFGVGYESNNYPIVKFTPETNQYVNIPLYKNGMDIILLLQNAENIEYMRVYDLFNVNEKLYCAFSVNYTSGKTTIEFYELQEDKFQFCQAFKASDMQMNKIVKNQMLFNSDAVLGDRCYLSLGNLYKTADFINFTKINVPDNASVTDLFVDKDSETLYVLAVSKNNEQFKNIIFSLSNDNLTEIYSFDHNCGALSFAKDDDCFYVGLGGDGINSDDIGKVFKITIN